MLRRVVVTGQGIVSSLGNNLAEVDASLRAARSGIRFNPTYAERGMRSQVSGRPTVDLEAAVDRRTLRFMGDAAAYSFLAMQQAIEQSGLQQSEVLGNGDETVELRVELFDARQQAAGQFFGGELLNRSE